MLDEGVLDELVEISHRTADLGLVVAGEGNVSARSTEGDTFWIKRSGCELGRVSGEDFVEVDLDRAAGDISKAGDAVITRSKEDHRASIEAAIHACIYHNQPDSNFVIHTHSPYALAGCCTEDVRGFFRPQFPDSVVYLGSPESNWVFLEYVHPGEGIARELMKSLERGIHDLRVVILANHGVITVGKTANEAMARSEMLEKRSLVRIMSSIAGSPTLLTEDAIGYLDEWESEKYRQRVMRGDI